MTTAILLEVDPVNSLGGSCQRDLFNMALHLKKIDNNIKINILHSSNKLNKSRFPKDCLFEKIGNWREQFTRLTKDLPENSTLFVMISGHGYQVGDKNNDEIDGKDEQIHTSGGYIIDDDLHKYFVDNIPNNVKFIGICDTCHSGSMFDLKVSWDGKKWVGTGEELDHIALSMGACLDNQLANCDVGNIVGFGGALSIHLIENNLVKRLFSDKQQDWIYAYDKIKKIFKKLNQIPTLQISERLRKNI